MKKNSKTRNKDIELYKDLEYLNYYDDYRYWGLFYNKKGRLMVDPKRFQKMTGYYFPKSALHIINNRNTHYFYPKKLYYRSYNITYFYDVISKIDDEWKNMYRPLIEREVERIKKVGEFKTVGDDDKFMCGISSYGAAEARARFYNMIRESEYNSQRDYLLKSMYAQFFHQMMSKTEAVFVAVLTKNHAIKDKFDRNILYATANKCDKSLDELKSFVYLDKAYCIWNFIKHNSESTYVTLKNRFPEVLIDGQYNQGEMAFCYIKFDNSLIQDMINGLYNFFEEYCGLVYNGENYEESQWNYEEYFEYIVKDKIDDISNPLGLDMFDDID